MVRRQQGEKRSKIMFGELDLSMLINYGGVLLGIIGLLLSIYLYLVSKETKEPRCYYATLKDVEKLNEENSQVKILYKSKEVNQVYSTYIWFWNAGRKPILSSDIPETSQLKLVFDGTKETITILDFKVIKSSRVAIKPQIIVNGNTLLINFNFLDHNDGFALEVQHTGDIYTEIIFDGVILGASKGVKVTPHPSIRYGDPVPNRDFVSPGWGAKINGLLIGGGVLYFIYKIFLRDFYNLIDNIYLYFLPIMFGIAALIILFIPWTSPFPFPKSLEFSAGKEKHDKNLLLGIIDLFRKR